MLTLSNMKPINHFKNKCKGEQKTENNDSVPTEIINLNQDVNSGMNV